MQVILVCVAHAARKAWMKRRTAGGDPGVEVMQEEIPATEPCEIIALEEEPADARYSVSYIVGVFYRHEGVLSHFSGRSRFPGRLRPASLSPG